MTVLRRKKAPVSRARSKGAKLSRGMGRGEILTEAMKLFSRHGYEGASTADIAAAAGLSQSVVLYHFGSKENLWREAMRGLFAKVNTQSLMNQEAFKDLDLLARLRIAIRRYAHLSAQTPEFGRVVTREGMTGGPRLRWLVEDLMPPKHNVFIRLLDEGIAAGVLKPCSSGHISMVMHITSNVIFLLAPLAEMITGKTSFSAEAVERHIDTVVDLLVSGLAVDPPARAAARSGKAKPAARRLAVRSPAKKRRAAQ